MSMAFAQCRAAPMRAQLDAFGPGDYGPSGEDVRHRFVLAGTIHLPGGFDVSCVSQNESARPITITDARQYRAHLGQRSVYQPRRIPRNALHRNPTCASLILSRFTSAGKSTLSSSSSTSSTATIPAQTSPSTSPNSQSLPSRCSPTPTVSPTSPRFASWPIAPRQLPSPASSNLRYPKEHSETSSGLALLLPFPSPPSWACEQRFKGFSRSRFL